MKRILILMALLSGTLPGAAESQNWDGLVDRFFDAYFHFNPSAATSAGFHAYDTQLEDLSAASIQRYLATLHRFETEFSAFPATRLSSGQAADRDLVLGTIRAGLLEFETIRNQERNPDNYTSAATNAIFVVMSRNFAPATQRLHSVIERERQIPALLAAARANLKNPPRIFTEVALEQLPGIISFFQKDIPLAFGSVQDQALLDQFRRSNADTVRELGAYENFLRNLTPKSNGDFRIGAENFRRKLLYEEMVDIPLERLLQIGYADLRNNQRMLRETAERIDPKKTPRQILDEANHDHPAPDKLLDAFRNTFGGLRDFIAQHNIATIPPSVAPTVEETPPFMRALTFASMDTPGPYETVGKEAFFNVTLPEKDWPQKSIEEHMSQFNRGTIVSTAIHEAYPGHYVQFLEMQNASSKVRKLLGANSNAEGWAHYCEQMMIDEGYGAGDQKHADLRLRIGQLQDALMRNARYIVGIEMHTGKMTYQQGIDFFVNEGMLTRTNGERETRRGTSDPTYLYYTLGKLQILKLREDYRKLRGPAFNLREFHDTFLKQGFPPIKIVRRAMLGNDSPVL